MSRPLLFLVALLLLCPAVSRAQSLRVWVASTGDDTNDGSRATPMRTFAAAHDATLPGGEINCVDSANYGSVVIGKSLTIDGAGVQAGISAIGTFAVTVSGAGASPIAVTLRNLELHGADTASASSTSIGVRIVGKAIVRVEHCRIAAFANAGIDCATTSTASALYVDGCSIHHCGAQGILVEPASSSNCAVNIVRTSITECAGAGVRAESGAAVTAREVNSTGNAGGFSGALGSTISIDSCSANFNVQGIIASGLVELINSDVIRNSGTGLLRTSSGIIKSTHNNRVYGNAPDGTANGTVTYK